MNTELVTRAIMYLEPELRKKGRSIDFDRFNQFVNAGEFNGVLTDDMPSIERAIAKYNDFEQNSWQPSFEPVQFPNDQPQQSTPHPPQNRGTKSVLGGK